jgi:hypothetical protein
MALLDELVYPFHDSTGQELHRTLIALQPAVPAVVLLAQEAGVDTSWLYQQQPVALLWKDVLDQAARAALLRPLVERVLARLASNHPAVPFLRGLLADQTPPVSAEPRADDGTPTFIHEDDAVSEPEALLFGADLTMPIGRLTGLIDALRQVLRVGPSVCKLTVGFGAGEQYGTGFRIGTNLLLTNWHVVHRRNDGTAAATVVAEFGYEDDAERGPLPGRAVRCSAEPVASDQADDWAVVRTLDPLDDAWPSLPLSELGEPAVHAAAYIVQHPMGQRKRVGFVRNLISYVDDRVVHYLTDTDVGSSGAPVLDAHGRLLALHHRGGRPQETLSAAPVRKNEGIRMSLIATALRDCGVVDAAAPLDARSG